MTQILVTEATTAPAQRSPRDRLIDALIVLHAHGIRVLPEGDGQQSSGHDEATVRLENVSPDGEVSDWPVIMQCRGLGVADATMAALSAAGLSARRTQ